MNTYEPDPSAYVHLRPARGLRLLDLRELIQYRDLLFFLVWRDIKVRYKQTVIGVAWVIVQPLAMMAVFTLFFGRLAHVPSNGLPYPAFALTGLLPWQLFSRCLSETTSSLITDQRLITKVYFPRILVPISVSLAALLDFGISLVLLVIVLAIYGITPGVNVVFLPLFALLLLVAVLGIGFWLSALNVEYRDVTYLMPFVIQLWLFLTPVVYPSSLVPAKWRFLYGLNPIVGAIEGFRWSVTNQTVRPGMELAGSVITSVLLFVTGIAWFRYRERRFVDTLGS